MQINLLKVRNKTLFSTRSTTERPMLKYCNVYEFLQCVVLPPTPPPSNEKCGCDVLFSPVALFKLFLRLCL